MLVIMVLCLVFSMMHTHLPVEENAQMFFEKRHEPYLDKLWWRLLIQETLFVGFFPWVV